MFGVRLTINEPPRYRTLQHTYPMMILSMVHAPRVLLPPVAAVFCGLLPIAAAFGEMNSFLLVSSVVDHSVAYTSLQGATSGTNVTLRKLIDSGLNFPQGLAVDAYRQNLYVADPSLQKLVGYKLQVSGDTLRVGSQWTLVQNQEVRWVAVDDFGNVYYTEEPLHRVMRITAEHVGATSSAEVVYDGSVVDSVDAPGGVFVDNFFVYWVNKLPMRAGTIVRGGHEPGGTTTALVTSPGKCYGICVTPNNIFYTSEKANLWGLQHDGSSAPVLVSSSFDEPRGCAYDGMSTVFVADKKKNGIYQFPSSMPTLRSGIQPSLVADYQGAYGIAVYTPTLETAPGAAQATSLSFGVALLALLGQARW